MKASVTARLGGRGEYVRDPCEEDDETCVQLCSQEASYRQFLVRRNKQG